MFTSQKTFGVNPYFSAQNGAPQTPNESAPNPLK